jgi:hypothetical protein
MAHRGYPKPRFRPTALFIRFGDTQRIRLLFQTHPFLTFHRVVDFLNGLVHVIRKALIFSME